MSVPCFDLKAEDCAARMAGTPIETADSVSTWRERQQAQAHEFLVQAGTALAIMLVVSLALGWFVAGRVLRPLRTMTTTVQTISARNVRERLAFDGPATS
ncbi:HAMP domain-containing protein [Actinomadura pelletieri DSM 43383]|uniref:HAMP domain-containing protein n=1 Tax=Actinomadura pelletieri DSM 43383 TaxID=1120940 RepID=A0A495QGD4_9ACTN|nr:hypothetical protein [Actinomadura pelletieri]RKS70972.1 HAMP domain-containing protein [Actinomadura pelletieri DSM 43383]